MFIQIFQSQRISENANAAIEVPTLQTGENNQMTILIQAFKKQRNVHSISHKNHFPRLTVINVSDITLRMQCTTSCVQDTNAQNTKHAPKTFTTFQCR